MASPAEPPRARTLPDAAAFLEEAGELLLADEARWSLPLGLALELSASPSSAPVAAGPTPWFAVVERGGRVHGAALQTPGRPVVVTDVGEADAGPLVEALRARSLDPAQPASGARAVPAIVGPAAAAARVAIAWSRATGASRLRALPQGLHRLDRLVEPARVPGRPRRAGPADESLARPWFARFAADTGLPGPAGEDAGAGPARIEALHAGGLHLWEDGDPPAPVAMAALLRPTPHGVSVGYVYTPDALRGRGYASALVAAVTRTALASGKRFCTLFTDLDNPVSNRIYARLGYRLVAEFRMERFEPPA